MKSPHRTHVARETKALSMKVWAALSVAAGLGGIPACAEHVAVPTEIASCPCSGGEVCCASGVCAENQNACTGVTRSLSESVRGTWTGYLESFTLSTDDSIKISIDVASDGALSGEVIVGKDPPPAPATDGNAVWPPTVDPAMPLIPTYIPGFAYAARNIRWENRRLRFEIAEYEAWQPWCALQQSYPVGPDSYSCVPGSGAVANRDPATGEVTCVSTGPDGNDVSPPVACFKAFSFCSALSPCACDAAGCKARTDFLYSFDIALRDGIGDGSTSLSGGNVRLTQSGR